MSEPPQPLPLSLQLFQVMVSFEITNIGTPTSPITLTSPQFEDVNGVNTLIVEQGIAYIVFQIQTTVEGELVPLSAAPQAQFPTYPIEWFLPGNQFTLPNGQPVNVPVSQPECFEVHWYNPFQCTIVDFNSSQAPLGNGHPFNVVVAYENQTYGTDPTIVNMPPATEGSNSVLGLESASRRRRPQRGKEGRGGSR